VLLSDIGKMGLVAKRSIYFVTELILISIIALYLFLALSSNPLQFWKKVPDAKVMIDGNHADVQVFQRPSGKLLIDLSNDDGGPHLYYPDIQNIGSCNPIRRIVIPGYIYAYDFDDENTPCVLMDLVKTERLADVATGNGHIEFTSVDGKRIRVSL
jgi:hypothetical protein